MQFKDEDSWQQFVDYCWTKQTKINGIDWECDDALPTARAMGDISIGEASELLDLSEYGHLSIVDWGCMLVLKESPPALRSKLISLVDPNLAARLLINRKEGLSQEEKSFLLGVAIVLYPDLQVEE